MDHEPRKHPTGRCPVGLIGAVALVVGFESSVARYDIDTLSGSQAGYRLAVRHSERVGDCRVLCFGDSMVKLGLSPGTIEATTGLRAYNFALAAAQPPVSYFLLKRALEGGARPSAIVVDYFPKLLGDDPRDYLEPWPFLATDRESLELAWTAGDPGLLAAMTMLRAIPSARCRTTLRANVLLALRGQAGFFRGEIMTGQRNWEVNRGAEIYPARPGFLPDLDAWCRTYFPGFRCTATNAAYIDRFLSLAGSRGIPVFWLLPPCTPAVQARCEESGLDADHEAFVRPFLARHPNLRVIDGRRAHYDPKVFFDLHHLGREGAATLSADVAALIRRHLDGETTPRWADLPAYRDRPMAYPIEDREQSREVVVREILSRLR